MSVHAGPADWWTDGTNAGRTHIATKGIVQSGLVLNLDAGVSSSYSGSGTTCTDLSGNGNHCTLYNGVTYDSTNKGRLIFNGSTQYVKTPSITNIRSIMMSCNIFVPDANWHYLLDSRDTGSWLAAVSGTWSTGSWNTNTFINGVSSSMFQIPFNQNIILYLEHGTTHTSNINIFSRYTDNETMGGSLFTFSVYNRQLSSSEIRQNFNATRGRFGI